jgi:tetratricopeptide (TPR) repeat protein
LIGGHFDLAMSLAETLVTRAPPGSEIWWAGAGTLLYGAVERSSPRLGEVIAHALDPSRPFSEGEPTGWLGGAVFSAACGMIIMGEVRGLDALVGRAESYAAQHARRDLVFDGFVGLARAFQAGAQRIDLGVLRESAAGAIARFERAGHLLGAGAAYGYAYVAAMAGGDLALAEQHAGRCIEVSRQAGSALNEGYGQGHLAGLHLAAGDPGAALAHAAQVTEHADRGVRTFAAGFAALALSQLGQHDAARATIGWILETPLAMARDVAHLVLARQALSQGRAEDALVHAEAGLAAERVCSTLLELGPLVDAKIAALEALGRAHEVEPVRAAAREELLRRARTFPDEASQRGFLGLPAHAGLAGPL